MPRKIETHMIAGPVGRLEALLEEPEEGAPRFAAVVCHPHPAYGGTRESHIVRALVRAFVARGMAALTFDFRGAGESQGEIEGGTGPRHVDAALTAAQARLKQLRG